MRIDRYHPLNRDVDVYLDGERLLTCLWADDVEGTAEVSLTDEAGKPLCDASARRPVTEIRKGRVRFEPHKGFEERFNWLQIGWAAGRDETLEKLKRDVRHSDDCTHWIAAAKGRPCSCGLSEALKGLGEEPDD